MCVFHRRKIDKQCPFTNWLDCFLKTQMFWWVFAFDLPTVMTWVVVWFPICPFPINQSVFFYIEISREDPTPLWPIFPDRLASKSWGLSGVFFLHDFWTKKNMLVIHPASKSISRKFLAPKVIQGRIQNGLCGHPFRSLADGAHLVGCFFGWNLTWGWMETHGNQSFSQIFLERRSIYQLYDQATRILTQQSQDMRRTWRWWWIHWFLPRVEEAVGKWCCSLPHFPTPKVYPLVN